VCAYENALTASLLHQPMMAVCTYALTSSRAAEIVDVAWTHQYVLARRGGAWEMMETPIRQQSTEAIQRRHAALEQQVAERTRQLTAVNTALRNEITERQRLEQVARRAEHLTLLGRLATGVSHEICNPLGAIFLHVDVLKEELRVPSPDSAAAVAETLADIKTNLARLDNLVQDYLTLARVTSLQRDVQELGGAVQAWGTEMQPMVEARGAWPAEHGEGQRNKGDIFFRDAFLYLFRSLNFAGIPNP
jgi:signal transduction histidine kinase